MRSPVSVENERSAAKTDVGSNCEQSFSTTLGIGGLFVVAESDAVGVLETGASAGFVCFRWLGRLDRVLRREGSPSVST